MKDMMRNYEEIRSTLLKNEDATSVDVDNLMSAIDDYFYEGVLFSTIINENAVVGYNQMTNLKRDNAELVLEGNKTIFIGEIEAKGYNKKEVQVKHRTEILESCKDWMKHRYGFNDNSFERLTAKVVRYGYAGQMEELGIPAKYDYSAGNDNSMSDEFNELLYKDVNGNPVQHAEDSKLWSLTSEIIGDTLQFGNRKIRTSKEIYDYLDNLTIEEIENNTIAKEIRVNGKRYGRGAKLTRVLTMLQEIDEIKPKTADEFNLQDISENIFLTANVIGAAAAGIISDSCFSPGGSNSYANIQSMNYKEVIWAFTDDLNWRTIITIDKENARATIHNGYPMNKIQNIRKIQYYLEAKGYEIVDSRYFDYRELDYWSYDSPITKSSLKDAYKVYADDTDKERIINVEPNISFPAYDIGDGLLTVWEEDRESLQYCDCCDGYQQNVVYINDYAYCSYCAMNMIESNSRYLLEGARNLVIRDRLEEMSNESTLDDIIEEIENITDYVAEHAYSILGRIHFYEWNTSGFKFRETDSSIDHFTKTSADYMHSSYEYKPLEEADFSGEFSEEVERELEDYFELSYNPFEYDSYLSDTDIENIVNDLVDYVIN